MFYYKQVFRKTQYFWRKLRKIRLWEDMTVLRGGECLTKKISITFFVRIGVLNIFQLTTLKKKTIFSKITEKLFLGAGPFQREQVVGRQK